MLTQKEILNNLNKYFPTIDKAILEKLSQYYFLIEEKNQVFNLTAFNDLKLVEEGLIESIFLLSEIDKSIYSLKNKKILDIGAGAGFPSLPYLIFTNEDFELTIYEPMLKRYNFLVEVKEKLNLKKLRILRYRAEDSKEFNYYNLITARAVAKLRILIEFSHKLGETNDCMFCFLKSQNYEEEIEESRSIIKYLNLKINIKELEPFFRIKNVLVYYKKDLETPNDIPRPWKKILETIY